MSANGTQSAPNPYGDCKNALLSDIGYVQEYGALLLIDRESGLIHSCSLNGPDFLGFSMSAILGNYTTQVLPAVSSQLHALADNELALLHFKNGTGVDLLATAYSSEGTILFEVQIDGNKYEHWWNHHTRVSFVEQLSKTTGIGECCEFLVRCIFERSRYDRTMLYRFLPNWDGEVSHEMCRPNVNGYLGLRFPGSDIPPNARRLFTENRHRLIPDVEGLTYPILQAEDNPRPSNLTLSRLRAVHPSHLEFLRNMGVSASLTISLLVRGKLWGLVSCHQLTPRLLPLEDTLAFEEMCGIASMHISNMEKLLEHAARAEMMQKLSSLERAFANSNAEPKFIIAHYLNRLNEAFLTSGAMLHYGEDDFFKGDVPVALDLEELRRFFDSLSNETVTAYSDLPLALAHSSNLAQTASGLLYIPLGDAGFIALFRPELVRSIQWAGKPQSLDADPATSSLSPRNSFLRWTQSVRNTAEAWTALELDVAGELQRDLIRMLHASQMERMALHDPLTGLGNRRMFERRLEQEIGNALEPETSFAIHLIDLDHFKEVNDTLGHAAGDGVLKEVAARLKAISRSQDALVRFGGDEFALVQTGLKNAQAAERFASRIVEILRAPFEIVDNSVPMGASVGVAIYPLHSVDQAQLLKMADTALYFIKRNGRNEAAVFRPEMQMLCSGPTQPAEPPPA